MRLGFDLLIGKAAKRAVPDGMVLIPGGRSTMGSNRFYPEERPVHRIDVAAFLMDRTLVTNRQFRAFVEATGYRTVAEQPVDPAAYPGVPPETLVPGSLVFSPDATGTARRATDWWSYVPGACWFRPSGPGSDLEGRSDHPVVHVAYADARAYARWAGKELPTEEQWEYAARGGLEGAEYCWGHEFLPKGRRMAHTWAGDAFPAWHGDRPPGPTEVGGYPANGFGLYDMAGNVWEWTSSWYTARHGPAQGGACCSAGAKASLDPSQPDVPIPRKVLKGGSFLFAPNYCQRYRPAARQPQMVDSASCHIGFRCIAPVT